MLVEVIFTLERSLMVILVTEVAVMGFRLLPVGIGEMAIQRVSTSIAPRTSSAAANECTVPSFFRVGVEMIGPLERFEALSANVTSPRVTDISSATEVITEESIEGRVKVCLPALSLESTTATFFCAVGLSCWWRTLFARLWPWRVLERAQDLVLCVPAQRWLVWLCIERIDLTWI